jgi:hypothetical protein
MTNIFQHWQNFFSTFGKFQYLNSLSDPIEKPNFTSTTPLSQTVIPVANAIATNTAKDMGLSEDQAIAQSTAPATGGNWLMSLLPFLFIMMMTMRKKQEPQVIKIGDE